MADEDRIATLESDMKLVKTSLTSLEGRFGILGSTTVLELLMLTFTVASLASLIVNIASLIHGWK